MKRKYLSWFAVILFFQINASGKNALFVGIGGYSSCNGTDPTHIGMAASIRNLFQNTVKEKWENAKYILGCLTTAAPPSGALYYVTSANPNRVDSIAAGDLGKLIQQQSENLTDPVFIVGHSYGGWTVMNAVLAMEGKSNVAGLYTLDPISPKSCGPWEVITGAPGCHQAPKDLDTHLINDYSTRWMNFYQRQDMWINSSAIETAENFLMEYRGPHTEIDVDPRVWTKIREHIEMIS